MTDALLSVAADGSILSANHAAEEMFGYRAEELVGRPVTLLVAESDRQGVRAFYDWLGAQREQLPLQLTREITRQRRDGSTFPSSNTITATVVGGELVVDVLCRELSQQRAVERALQESEANLRALMNAPTDAAVLVDKEGMILALNRNAAARLGEHDLADEASLVGRCIYDLFPSELREYRRARNEEVLCTGHRASYDDERNGRWSHNTIDPIFDADGSVVRLAVFSHDVTDRRNDERRLRAYAEELEALNGNLSRAMEELAGSQAALASKSQELERALNVERERARHDGLTGALSHAAISELLFSTVSTDAPLAIAMVDVDGMKSANDTYGHLLGDAVLVAVVEALRVDGAIVGRYRGDEFLAVLPGADLDAAARYRERVYERFAETTVRDDETGAAFPVRASVGVAARGTRASDARELIELADTAMYEEKRRRRDSGTVRFDQSRRVSDRAAQVAAEVLPVLTLPVSLVEKLRLASQRLAVAAGYDVVTIELFDDAAMLPAGRRPSASAPDALPGAWRREQPDPSSHSLGSLFSETREPVVAGLVEDESRLTAAQRSLLLAAGARSGMVAPLLWNDAVVGVICGCSRTDARFGPEDGRLLAGVAVTLTPVLRMAQEIERLGDRLEKVEPQIKEPRAA
jgi:diguanylate cyclase (GGDEF)-like protein/PAS domain S-box-containing protein